MKRFILTSTALVGLFSLAAAPHVSAQAKDAKPPMAQPSPAVELLDINTATLEQLEALPAIGKAYGQKIIKGRPYKSKDQLWERKIVSKAVYAKVKDQIIAKQDPKSGK